jgi:aerobic C4-dicarboxylate transport protein
MERAQAVLRGEIPYTSAPETARVHEPQDDTKPQADPVLGVKLDESEAADPKAATGSNRDPVPTAG